MIEKLYTVEEVAELASVTGRTIRNYLKSGRLLGRKIGGQWRFPESEVQRLLTGGSLDETDVPEGNPSVDTAERNDISFPVKDTGGPFSSQNAFEEETDPHDFYAPPPQKEAAPQPINTAGREATTSSVQPTGYVTPAPLPSAYPPPPAQSYPVNVPPVSAAAVSQPVTPSYASATPSQASGPIYPMGAQTPANVTPTSTGFSSDASMQGYPEASYQPAPQPTPNAGFSQSFQQSVAAPPTGTGQTISNTPDVTYTSPVYTPPPAVPAAEAPIAAPPASDTTVPAGITPNSVFRAQDVPELSDVGKRVAQFAAEVHDCSSGPKTCAIIDVHQALSNAKVACERLVQVAEQESEGGTLCQVFVEYDERYFVARYTLFGTSNFLVRCLKLLG